ncbi:MAG: nitroreductase family protein [Bacillota bacterium]
MNSVLETIKNRRSIRAYKPEQLQDSELEKIMEAATFAPSGHNQQPWHFTVIQNKALIDALSRKSKDYAAKSDVEWIAKLGKNENLHIFYNAPTVVIVSGKEDAISTTADCCAAIQNMLLAAESLNIGSCWIGLANFFFASGEQIDGLNFKEGYKPVYAVSLGYKASSIQPAAPKRKENVVSYIK